MSRKIQKFFSSANQLSLAEQISSSKIYHSSKIKRNWKNIDLHIEFIFDKIKLNLLSLDKKILLESIDSNFNINDALGQFKLIINQFLLLLDSITLEKFSVQKSSNMIIIVVSKLIAELSKFEKVELYIANVVYPRLIHLYCILLKKTEISTLLPNQIFYEFYHMPVPLSSNSRGVSITINYDKLAIAAYEDLTKNRFQFIAYKYTSETIYAIKNIDQKSIAKNELYLKMLNDFLAIYLVPDSMIFSNNNFVIKDFDKEITDKVKQIIPEFEKNILK